MREFKSHNIEHDEKMSINWVYAGHCCPWCTNPTRWNKWKGIKNSKKKTLRTHRQGINKQT